MSENQSTRKRYEMQLTDDEVERADRLRERLHRRIEQRAGVAAPVTRRTVFVEALEALERELDEKERKR